MYPFVLFLHGIFRWVVAAFAFYAIFKAVRGWRSGQAWTESEGRFGKMYAGVVDLQVLLGLILYVGVSPLMSAIFSDFGAAMRTAELRFFALEHILYGVLGAAFVHLGSRVDKSDKEDSWKWRRAAMWFGLGLASFLLGTPWFRPLLPF